MVEAQKKESLSKEANNIIKLYCKNFNYICNDIETRKRDLESERLLSLDFHEIYSYIFDTKIRRDEFRLLDYVFNNQKDCKIILTPPAVYELINFYESMSLMTKKYTSYRELLSIPQVRDYFKAYKDLRLAYKDKDPNLDPSKDITINRATIRANSCYDALVKYGDSKERKIGSLGFLLDLSTSRGLRRRIETPHNNLIDLFKRDKIVSLEKALEAYSLDFNKIKDIKIDPGIYKYTKDYLDVERPNRTDNNVVDAEMAGLTAGFNKIYENDKIFMNIFTGSKVPSKALETYRDIFKGPDLPRCPMYGLIRFYLHDKLNGDYNEMYDYAIACKGILGELNNIDDIIGRFSKKLSKNNHEKIVTLFKSNYYFMKLLYYDYELGECLIEAAKSLDISENIRNSLNDLLVKVENEVSESKDNNNEDFEEEFESLGRESFSSEGLEEQFTKAKLEIQENAEYFYKNLYDYINEYDFQSISPNMYESYRLIKEKMELYKR